MSECYFTVEEAKRYIEKFEHITLIYKSETDMENACREIIRLNEENEKLKGVIEQNMRMCHPNTPPADYKPGGIYCGCGEPMVQVRPGKWQCPECE